MGITRINPNREASETTPVTIIQKVVEPVVIASKKYWQSEPKEFLGLCIFTLLLLLTFIQSLLRESVWSFTVAYIAWTIVYFPDYLKKIIKKPKKK